jgi:hypothetical protein
VRDGIGAYTGTPGTLGRGQEREVIARGSTKQEDKVMDKEVNRQIRVEECFMSLF